MSALRGQRSNAPFTEEQETWIILEYGALRNYLQVRRKFRLHYKLSPAKVPGICAFERLISRFIGTNGHLRGLQRSGGPQTNEVREWLKKKFDGRVISRMMDQPWPAKSPDLSPLDYWFWGVAMSELRRVPPSTLSELKMTVEAFAESLDSDEVKRCTKHIRERARACIEKNGGQFERSIKKHKIKFSGDN